MGIKRNDEAQIRIWMRRHVRDHIDECNEANATKLVEAWDFEVAGGGATLDPDHIAWEIGAEVAAEWDTAHAADSRRSVRS